MPRLSELAVSPWRGLSESEIRRVVGVTSNLVSKLEFVTDWRLQKAYYLAEVWSVEERLCRLSAADFASWTHGPWSLHVRESAEILEAKGILARAKQRAKRRPEAEFLKVVKIDQLSDVGEKDEEFLESMSKQMKYLSGEKLTDIAKGTQPYLATKRGQRIDLSAYLESLKRKHKELANSPRAAALIAEAKAD
jgi:uncharacterized phage-associated protein